MLTLFSAFMLFLSVCMSQHGVLKAYRISNIRMPIKRINTNNLMTFECCFLISKYHENCNAMSSFIILRHVSLHHGTLLFAVQINVYISSLWSLFIVYYLSLKKTDILISFGWLKRD